ncbi:MAG TPA: sigma 54-interacting transcriptional regulator, partial [Vicinamibacteria bacterium]
IGELPLELQAKLLRILQEGRFEPVGSDRTVKVDVRILAATHVDLEKAIAGRRFREDLYYRLSVFPLRLPPLRERLEDLPRLATVLLAEQARRTGRRGVQVTREGLRHLAAHSWPGNLRELGNVLERGTILATGRELGPEVLDLPARPSTTGQRGSAPFPLRAPDPGQKSDLLETANAEDPVPPSVLSLDEVQRLHIRRVLVLTGGKLYGERGAAAVLGLKPTTLQSRMKKLGVSRFDVSYGGSPPSGRTRE